MHTRNTIPKMKITTIGTYKQSNTDPDHKIFTNWHFDSTGLEGTVGIYWDEDGVLLAGYTPEELTEIYNDHHHINIEFIPSKPKRQLVDILAMDSDIFEPKKIEWADLDYDITFDTNRLTTLSCPKDDTEELQAKFDEAMTSHTPMYDVVYPVNYGAMVDEVTEELRDFNEMMNAAFDRHEWLAAEGAFDSDRTGGCRKWRQSHLNATYSDYYDECMCSI